tara:strand:+ start:273 stop:1190 length:918 start_codon:yes stop_codon:yes gene_type:complete
MTDQIEDQDVELDDDNVVEEAHDPKNAEEASVASVKTAEGKGPKAKARKGDKKNSDPMVKVTAKEAADIEVQFKDEMDSLMMSEATLSDEFKAKAGIIFEANVKAKLAEEIDRLEEAYATELEEELATTKADLVEKVDNYLNYVVETWMEENKLAVQSGLRSEIAEGFMTGLKTLFTESYVDVPESKIDLVDELSEQVEEMSAQVNSLTEAAMAASTELATYKREAIIAEAAKGLADTQTDKLRTMVEDFDLDDDFAHKVAVVKESVFAAKKTSITEEVLDDEAEVAEISETMSRYLTAIKNHVK